MLQVGLILLCFATSIVFLKGHKESITTALLNDLYVQNGSSA